MFQTGSEKLIVQKLKDEHCYFSLDYEEESKVSIHRCLSVVIIFYQSEMPSGRGFKIVQNFACQMGDPCL